MRKGLGIVVGAVVCVGLAAFMAARADDAAGGAAQTTKTDAAANKGKADELTLEDLFPKKSFFGPSASRMAFSYDGRWAAYVYRPYVERRHGSDLWLYDPETGTVKRITSVSVLSKYSADVRKVRDDRIRKAREARKRKGDEAKPGGSDEAQAKAEDKKAPAPEEGAGTAEDKGKTDKSGEGSGGKTELTDDQLADTVDDKDADDEKAPRHGGIFAYTWSPKANELIFLFAGDLFRYIVGTGEMTRLTVTREPESGFAYLPDGTGYTYMRGGALIRVIFGSDRYQQLDPRLGEGESMTDYSLSRDGTKLAFLTRKADASQPAPPDRKVTIMNYEGRFAQAREVSRQVSDDPTQPSEVSAYLMDLAGLDTDEAKPVKVYTQKVTAPRDVVQVPEWALDSSRATFSVYEQSSRHLRVLEATLPPPGEKSEQPKDASTGDKPKEAGDGGKSAEEADSDPQQGRRRGGPPSDTKPAEPPAENPAKVVYECLHNGGPDTPGMVRPYYLPDNRRIIFLTEQSGFRHLAVLDPLYETVEPITSGHYELHPEDITDDHKWMFVSATKESPECTDIYKVSLEDFSFARVSPLRGTYGSAALSPDGTRMLARYVRYGALPELVAVQNGEQKALTDSHPEVAKKLCAPVPEFFTYKNRYGHEIHGMMFKPEGWKAEDKRPCLIYVYGGPLGTSRMVEEGSYSSDGYFFAYYMAKKYGYVTCTIDPRGMSGYGAMFEKANFEQVGKPQVEDLVDGAKYLAESSGVDPKRIGIHGWSFGGFQTQMCLYSEPDVFAVGIAGAGPTEWENYNNWYTQGVVGNTRAGQPDLAKYSLVPLAKNLKARLLLVHGMADDNVLYQDTVKVYAALLDAGKEALVDLFLDPSGGHGLGGHVKQLGRFRKYESFLLGTLGRWEPPAPPKEATPPPAGPAAAPGGGTASDQAKAGAA